MPAGVRARLAAGRRGDTLPPRIKPFRLSLWTDDPELARHADAAGVVRIGVDLERLGKAERQQKLNTWISLHREDQIPAIGRALSRAKLFVRTNPVNPDSGREVERLLELGTEVLMLPMFTSPAEVESFVESVDGRASTVLLLEHAAAVECLDEIVGVPGIDEVHIGLTDLSLSLGLGNRFAVLGSNLMARICDRIHAAGIPLGIGGIGRAHDTRFAVPSDLIYAQHARLGSSAALLSQIYLQTDSPPVDLSIEVARTRRRMAFWATRDAAELETARLALVEATRSTAGVF